MKLGTEVKPDKKTLNDFSLLKKYKKLTSLKGVEMFLRIMVFSATDVGRLSGLMLI